jgi:glycosyltransferase involved in cell wall biosynthesis
MRILFLTQVLPYPLDAGPKIRAYYVLRHLAQRHEVTLVSFVRATDAPAALAHLRTFCKEVHAVAISRSPLMDVAYLAKSLVTGAPFIIERDWRSEMSGQLGKLLKSGHKFDAVHADQLWMAPYALWVRRRANGAAPRLTLDQHNAVYMIPARMAQSEGNPLKRALLVLEARKMLGYEIATCRQFDHVTWVTHEDFAALQQHMKPEAPPLLNAGVIPICGDPEVIKPIPRAAAAHRITFLGGLHYPPNAQGILWFARHVFPQVLAQAPDAVLTVIGKQPPQALASLGIPATNLALTGYVDDPTPYLATTAVFIVPLLAGGGMRVKIIEGWSWGLPMVSTTVGAEGIETRPGENLLIADTPEAFAHATLRLFHDREAAGRLSQTGRSWVLQNYNWRTTYQKWDAIYL